MKPVNKLLILLGAALTLSGALQAQLRLLSLEEALQLAAKGNRQLQIQQLEARQSAEAIREARSLKAPTVYAAAGYQLFAERPVIFLRNEATQKKVTPVAVGGRNAFSGSVVGTYPLLQPSLDDRIRLAEISGAMETEKIRATESRIAFEVAQLYLNVLLHGEQLLVVEQSLQRNEQALNDARSLFRQGKSLKTDTLRNYIAVQNLQAARSALENNRQVLLLNLKHLLGLAPGDSVGLSEQLLGAGNEPVISQGEITFEQVVSRRPEIRVLQLQAAYSAQEAVSAKSEFRPQLLAYGQYQLQAQSDRLAIWKYTVPRTSFVGLQLQVPIYSGSRLKYKTSRLSGAAEQSRIEVEELKSRTYTEIETWKAQLQEAIRQKHLQARNVEAAEAGYRMMHDRYRQGVGSRLELMDAELALTEARMSHLNAVYNILITDLNLARAAGSLRLK